MALSQTTTQREVFALVEIKFQIRYLEGNSFVWLSCYQHVLILGIRLLYSLLETRHNSELWLSRLVQNEFWELQFKQKGSLVRIRIFLSNYSVARLTDPFGSLMCFCFFLMMACHRVFRLPKLSLLKIGLVLFA